MHLAMQQQQQQRGNFQPRGVNPGGGGIQAPAFMQVNFWNIWKRRICHNSKRFSFCKFLLLQIKNFQTFSEKIGLSEKIDTNCRHR